MTPLERDWLAAEESLTESEWEVIDGIAKGWTCNQIAEWLGIKPTSVRVYIHHVAHKLPPHNGLTGYARVLYWIVKQPHQRQIAA